MQKGDAAVGRCRFSDPPKPPLTCKQPITTPVPNAQYPQHERKRKAVLSAKDDIFTPLEGMNELEKPAWTEHRPGKRSPKAKPVVEFPEALPGQWIDPPTFPEALLLHMQRHGDSSGHLHKAVAGSSDRTGGSS